MLQRIQSLYLFLAAVLMALMTFLPIAEFIGDTETYRLSAFGLTGLEEKIETDMISEGIIETAETEEVRILDTLPMGIVICVAGLLALITIFLFKKRFLQLRLCVTEYVLLIGAQAFALLYYFRILKTFEMFAVSGGYMKLPMFFPVIALILVWFARRGIVKDIRLIKSLDRIR